MVPNVAEWSLARAFTILLEKGSRHGDLKMADIAQVVLFILAGTFLYGLVGFLFRDQITSRQG
jgi:hypothetical protein